MAITDIFNTSFFILLGICFIVIGVVGYYLSQIILQQNQKISGMVDLISTMAQEMEFIRAKTQHITFGAPQFFTGGSGVGVTVQQKEEKQNHLIAVSDDEEDDDDDDDDDEEDDDDDDDDDDEDEEDETAPQDNIRIINFGQQSKEDDAHYEIDNQIEELEDTTDVDQDDDLDDDDEHDEDDQDESGEDAPLEMNVEQLEEKVDFQIFKKLDIDISQLDSKPVDYKKLSLEKLKSVAIEKNIENAAKMKKNELLKALESV